MKEQNDSVYKDILLEGTATFKCWHMDECSDTLLLPFVNEAFAGILPFYIVRHMHMESDFVAINRRMN